MAEKLGEALLDIDTDDRKFNQGVDRAERRAQGFGRVLDDTARRALQLGKTLAVAAGLGGAAAFGKGIFDAVKRLEEMRKMSAQVDRALANTGNTAETSAKEIEAWADALENRTGRAVEDVMAVTANLASYGFGREEFYRAIELANDMAAAWGGDLQQNLEGLARALDDPINGMAMLSKRGVKLTDDQKALASSFLDAGDKAAAQGVVFDALEAQVKGVAEAGFGGLTKALAVAQKVWETAFEDLVTGKGNAADLTTTLEQLIATLSSKEFVDAAMGFGNLMVQIIQGIANAAIAANEAVRGIKDFLANNDSQVSTEGLQREFNVLDRQVATQKGQLFGDASLSPQQRDQLGNDVMAGIERMQAIQAELDRRKPQAAPVITPGTIDPYAGQTFTTDATQQERDAVQGLIDDLKAERDMVGISAREQEILNAIRRAGAVATTKQKDEIRNLITETQEHEDQLKRQKDLYGALGQAGKTAIQGIVGAMDDGIVTGGELLGILGNLLSQAGSFFMGQGAKGGGDLGGLLSTIFSGFFADGGTIPNGQFGIVGENGPEPVWGGAGGAHVMSNPDFMSMLGGGGLHIGQVSVDASGMTPEQASWAISDALDRFSRHVLPGRVADINRDPLARG